MTKKPKTETAEEKPTKGVRKRKLTNYNTDKRRKHRHWQVTVFYADGERFGRVYTDKDKATRFADRQKRSPVVKSARVTQLS
jgi:hypothetical protein